MITKKLKIGWFSFSCCEDSTIIFIELMNDNFFKWKDMIEFRHVRVLKSKNELSDIDVAFVEGAIAYDNDEKQLISIRQNSKKLVAIGSCAVKGTPSGQRNEFDEDKKKEILPYIIRWGLKDKVKTLKEIVSVDDEIDGCPMNETAFLGVMNKYLKEFGIDA